MQGHINGWCWEIALMGEGDAQQSQGPCSEASNGKKTLPAAAPVISLQSQLPVLGSRHTVPNPRSPGTYAWICGFLVFLFHRTSQRDAMLKKHQAAKVVDFERPEDLLPRRVLQHSGEDVLHRLVLHRIPI